MNIYKANIIYAPALNDLRILPHGYVVVGDDGIVVGCYETLPEQYASQMVTDFGDRLLLPAFNDLHVHAPQYRNMGLAMDEELLPWLNRYTFPEESKFRDNAYAEHIYRRFVHELWMQGTMRATVFGTIHPEATRILMNLFREAGMGAYVGLVGMDRNAPDTLRNTAADVRRFHEEEVASAAPGDKVQTILTPRFIPSCTPEMLRTYGDLVQKYQLRVQSHLSENRSEIEFVRELEPEATCYGDAYNRYGLFGQTPTLMAHCCYSLGEELELIKRNKVIVVHCPASNMNVASGIAGVRTFLNEGVPVALGSDVSARHHMSILRTMQYAIQASKLQYAATKGAEAFLSVTEAFYLATKAGGSFFGKVGSFEPGYHFDALLVDDTYLNYDNFSLDQRLGRFIYLGDDRDIRRRWCDGQQLVEPVF